jgi:hypothetical protein
MNKEPKTVHRCDQCNFVIFDMHTKYGRTCACGGDMVEVDYSESSACGETLKWYYNQRGGTCNG